MDVGGNQILFVYDLSQTSGVQDMQWAGACLSPIEQLGWDWHSDSISLSSVDGNRFIIYMKIQVFGGPNTHVSQNVVTTAFEAL